MFLFIDRSIYGQEKLVVELDAGINGIARVGYTPIKVDMTNKSKYENLKVQFIQENEESDSIEYTEDIKLSLEKSQTYYFYIPLKSTNNSIDFKIYGENELLYEDKVKLTKILKAYNPVIGVSENIDSDFLKDIDLPSVVTNTSDYNNVDTDASYKTEIINLKKDTNLFNNKKAFSIFDILILEKLDYEFFNEENFSTILEWVNNGGIIIIGSGENPIGDFNEIESKFKLINYRSSFLISNDYSLSDSKIFIGNILSGKETDYLGGNPITINKSEGYGSIINLAFDINSFKSENKSKKLEIIKNAIFYNNYMFNTDNIENKNSISKILSDISDNLPFNNNYNYIYMLSIFSIYVLIVLILILVVFRKRDKRNLLWYLIPVATILCSIPIFYIGNKNNLDMSPVISSVSVAKYNSDESSLSVNSYFTTLNNNKDSLNLSVNKNSDVEFVENNNEDSSNDESIHQSSKLEVTQNESDLWEKEYVVGVKNVDIGDLQCESNLKNNILNINLDNNTNADLEKSFIIYDNKCIEVGNIIENESKSIDIDINKTYPALNEYLNNVFSYPESLDEYEVNELYNVLAENPSLYTETDIENKRINNVIKTTLEDNGVINKDNLKSNEFIFLSINSDNYWDDIEVNSEKPDSYNINLIYSTYKYSYETDTDLNISNYEIKFDNKTESEDSVKVVDGMFEIKEPCILELEYSIKSDIKNISSFKLVENEEDQSGNLNYEIYNVKNNTWDKLNESMIYENIEDYLDGVIKLRIDKTDKEGNVEYIKIPKISVRGEYGND
jgi:hypothetical protein